MAFAVPACLESTVVVAMGVALDSTAGMFFERLYPDEVQGLRDEDCTLCEFTQVAMHEATHSRVLLTKVLFHVAFAAVANLVMN